MKRHLISRDQPKGWNSFQGQTNSFEARLHAVGLRPFEHFLAVKVDQIRRPGLPHVAGTISGCRVTRPQSAGGANHVKHREFDTAAAVNIASDFGVVRFSSPCSAEAHAFGVTPRVCRNSSTNALGCR